MIPDNNAKRVLYCGGGFRSVPLLLIPRLGGSLRFTGEKAI
jgi:hypothetical protein